VTTGAAKTVHKAFKYCFDGPKDVLSEQPLLTQMRLFIEQALAENGQNFLDPARFSTAISSLLLYACYSRPTARSKLRFNDRSLILLQWRQV
jgi:hypothetical protein